MLKDLIKIANKLDKSGFFKEADILDSIIRKSATPREMYDELQEILDAGELINIEEEDRTNPEKLNYLDLSDRFEAVTSEAKRLTMSSKKISRIGNFTQSISRKPNGLWYACGNEWIERMAYEMPEWIGNYIYSIDLNEGSILNIRGYNQIKDFDKTYGVKTEWGWGIDWQKVANEGYGGIEICPHSYRATRSMDWYASWEVASGCIWSPSAVKSIKLIAEKTSDSIRPYEVFPVARREDPPNWALYK